MNNQLENYEAFRKAVNDLRLEKQTLVEFSKLLKNDPNFKQMRNQARNELQNIYDFIRNEHKMPILPVYLPVRKKILTRGLARHAFGIPQEIRLYFLQGSMTKPYEEWTPKDLDCCSRKKVFEILIHESAHVLEACWHGEMGHEKPFVEAYQTIESFLEQSSFDILMDKRLRLLGCPENSYADKVAKRSKLK